MTASASGLTVAFIGLGNMGRPMARRLAEAGVRLKVHDVSGDAMDRFCAENAQAQACPLSEVGRQADVVILILPNGHIVREVLLSGESALADSLAPGCLVIDMSSSAPMGTRALGDELAARGLAFIDAPVSGGVVRAVNGTLAAMIGGEADAVERARPVLEAMCAKLIHVGALGAGHAMKALNNYVSAAGLTAACEAVRAAERFGIDGQRAVDALNASSGRNNSTETKMAQFVLSESYGSGFSAGLMRKDLQIALELIDALGMRAPLAHAFIPIWAGETDTIGPAADHTEIARTVGLIRDPAGVASLE